MRELKYIRTIFDDFLLFPAWLGHAEAVEGMKLKNPEIKVESAGFVGFFEDGPVAHGESTSLGIASRPEDTGLLRAFLRMA